VNEHQKKAIELIKEKVHTTKAVEAMLTLTSQIDSNSESTTAPSSFVSSSSNPASSSSLASSNPNYTSILYRRLRMLEKSNKVLAGLQKKFTNKIYTGSTEARRLTSTALAHCPRLLMSGAKILISSTIRAVFLDTGLTISDDSIYSSPPPQATLSTMLQETTTEVIQ